jgi:transcriptional regulator with XRE-family HTH domain
MDLSSLAGRATFVRGLLDLSARNLSAAVHLSPSMWALLESGDKNDPRTSTLTQISKHCSIALEWLATGNGPMLSNRPDLDALRTTDHAAITELVKASLARSLPPPAPTPKKRRTPTSKRAAKAPAHLPPQRSTPRTELRATG